MRLLLKNENGCTVSVPIQQSDTFLDLKKRLFEEFGLEFDIDNFRTEGGPIDCNSNVLKYLQIHSDENKNERLRSQMCRLCGEIFDVNEMTDVSELEDKIINCLHLKVELNLLSNLVCLQCVRKLNDFQKFLDGCLNAEKKQLEIFKSHKNSCPFCNKSSSPAFVNNLDFMNSKERHENVCLKSSDDTSLIGGGDDKDINLFHEVFKGFEPEKGPSLSSGESLSESENSKKKKRRNMFCDMCRKSFRSKKRLEFHIEFHLKGLNARICTTCKKEYSSEVYLYNHIQHNHSNKKLFPCDICEKKFRNKSSLTYHLRSHEGFEAMKPYVCNICNKRFARQNILNDHMMSRHGVTTNSRPGTCFQCQVCKETFPNTNSGISHTEIHHSNEMNDKTGFSFNMQTVYKLFLCEFCDKCYSLPQDLIEHKLGHSAPLRYQCKVCNEEFENFAEMRSHLDDHIADGLADYKTDFDIPIYYICEFCEKYFKSYHAFVTHSKTHLSDKSYLCQFCLKGFSSYSELLIHRRSHENVGKDNNQLLNVFRPFECRFCQKAFTSNSSLTKHIRVHTGEKPFKCDVCGKSFAQSSGLYTHLKIHSKCKPHQCDFCGKTFKLLGNYKQHMKRHSDEK